MLCIRNFLENDFDRFLSVFIKDFELLSKVVEELAKGSIAICRDEVDLIAPAELIDLFLFFVGSFSGYDNLELS